MRLGLLADIHEAVEPLAAAVRELRARRVEAFVMLGDACEDGQRIEETVELLAALPGAGVWGNHDFGLVGEIKAEVRDFFPPRVLDYFATLKPRLDLGGWRFQHIDPQLDPTDGTDLWLFTTDEERTAGFARCGLERFCMGHLHDWRVHNCERRLDWTGEDPIRFPEGEARLVAVHAVCRGWCAVLDTAAGVLEPVRVK